MLHAKNVIIAIFTNKIMSVSNIKLGHPWKPNNIEVYTIDKKEYVSASKLGKILGKPHLLLPYQLEREDVGSSRASGNGRKVAIFIDVDAIPDILSIEYDWDEQDIDEAMKYFRKEIKIPIFENEVERHAKRIAEELRETIFNDPVLIKKYKDELKEHIWRQQVDTAKIMENLRNE
jgi:hypothetical protein